MEKLRISTSRQILLLFLIPLFPACGISGIGDDRHGHIYYYNRFRFLECDGVVDTFVADATKGDDDKTWGKVWIKYKSAHMRLSEISEEKMQELGMSQSNALAESGMTVYSNNGLAMVGFVEGKLRFVDVGGDSLVFISPKEAVGGIKLPCPAVELEGVFGPPIRKDSVKRTIGGP